MATVKTAWITGVTGNLGWALAQAFLAEGYFVHGFARKWKNDLVVPEGNFKFWPIDLQNATETQAVATKLQLEHAVPDVVIMAAGTFKPGDWSAWTAEELHQMIQRNVDTAVNIIQPIFPSILEKGSGRIFFIGAKPGLDIK